MRKLLLLVLLLIPTALLAQEGNFQTILLSGSGQPINATVAVCSTGLATTAASVTNNIATLTMASNPQTANFLATKTLTVSAFTGADTYFNGTFTIVSVSPTAISYALVHANASAGTNGRAFQTGDSISACAPLVTLYTDDTGLVTTTNPFPSGTLGNVSIWTVPGVYNVQYYGQQLVTKVVEMSIGAPGGGPASFTTLTVTGDALFKSGRPWYDVMAFGAKNDGATDDTIAVQAAITAACTSTPSGIVFFPPGKSPTAGYLFAGPAAPISLCNDVVLLGASRMDYGFSSTGIGNSLILCAGCTGAIITNAGTVRGWAVYGLSLKGHGASPAGMQGVNVTGSGTIEQSNFYNFGSSAIVTNSAGNVPITLRDIAAVGNLLGQAGGSTDIGVCDTNSPDIHADNVYCSIGLGAGSGQLGTGHRYAWVIRNGTGHYNRIFAEQSEHGILNLGTHNEFTDGRMFLNQGNGFHNKGSAAIVKGMQSLGNGQNANNTFSGFINDGTGSNSLFANNDCGDNAGTGLLQSDCFQDINSNGGTQNVVENIYANNRAPSNAIAGVKYNFTGTVAPRVVEGQNPSADNGDTSPTFQCWLNSDTQYFNTILTGNRTLTLSTTGAWSGCKVRVVRTASATGAFTLTVNGLALYPGNDADFEFIAGAWKTVGANMPLTVASGAQALNTASITTATCDAGVAATANGALSTDRVIWSFSAAITTTSKYGAFLVVYAVPSANVVTFFTCNPSATTSTPTAMTVNWSVVR